MAIFKYFKRLTGSSSLVNKYHGEYGVTIYDLQSKSVHTIIFKNIKAFINTIIVNKCLLTIFYLTSLFFSYIASILSLVYAPRNFFSSFVSSFISIGSPNSITVLVDFIKGKCASNISLVLF